MTGAQVLERLHQLRRDLQDPQFRQKNGLTSFDAWKRAKDRLNKSIELFLKKWRRSNDLRAEAEGQFVLIPDETFELLRCEGDVPIDLRIQEMEEEIAQLEQEICEPPPRQQLKISEGLLRFNPELRKLYGGDNV